MQGFWLLDGEFGWLFFLSKESQTANKSLEAECPFNLKDTTHRNPLK